MRLYVSAHDRADAERVAGELIAGGHAVVSTWHTGEYVKSAEMSVADKASRARSNRHQIRAAEGLVLVACDGSVPGGKFFEAGIAVEAGKRVVVLGRRENLMLHHPDVLQADDVAGVLAALG